MAKRSITVNYTGNQGAESKSFTDVNPLATANELQAFGRDVVSLMAQRTYASVESTEKRNVYEQQDQHSYDEGDVFPSYLYGTFYHNEGITEEQLINKVDSSSIQDITADHFGDESLTIEGVTYTRNITVAVLQSKRDPSFITNAVELYKQLAKWFTGQVLVEDASYYGEEVYYETKYAEVALTANNYYGVYLITIHYTEDQDPTTAETYLKVVMKANREFGECVVEYRFRGGAE